MDLAATAEARALTGANRPPDAGQGSWAAHYVPSERGPARKYYRLTAAGAQELTRSLDSWNHLAGLVSSITAKGTLR